MNRKLRIATAISASLLASLGFAQQRGGDMSRDRDPAAASQQERQMDRDQTYDRERLLDRDTMRDADRSMDRDRDQTQDRDQDRDMLHLQDRDRLRDEDIYGSALMTTVERNQYRERLDAAGSDREWAQIRAEHQQQIQARAEQRGVDLAPPIYGESMMTVRELAQYRERLEAARDDAERARLQAEHAERMQERARELGVPLAPAAE